MHEYDEKKIIKLSLVVLFLSLMIIYVLLYYIKGDDIKSNLATNSNSSLETTNYQKDLETTPKISELKDETSPFEEYYNELAKTNSGSNKPDITTGTNNGFNAESEFPSDETISGSNKIDIKMLSGTVVYYGPIESIEKLGVNYQYSLRDMKDIYYVYLGDNNQDLTEITRKLGGNLYVINTEQEIMKNKLFGEKVTYINIPEYKDKLVIIILEIDGKKRLIQVSYSIYYKSKTYLKDLFENSL